MENDACNTHLAKCSAGKIPVTEHSEIGGDILIISINLSDQSCGITSVNQTLMLNYHICVHTCLARF